MKTLGKKFSFKNVSDVLSDKEMKHVLAGYSFICNVYCINSVTGNSDFMKTFECEGSHELCYGRCNLENSCQTSVHCTCMTI